MWQFVKYSLATVVGLFLFAIVSLLLLAGVGAAIGSSDEVYDLKDNSVLKPNSKQKLLEKKLAKLISLSDFPSPYDLVILKNGKHPKDDFFSSSHLDILSQNRYAISFENYKGYILNKILPQLFFSIFLFSVILLSFFIMWQNLEKQRRLTELKNDFISNITHELKTPITTVGVALEALSNFNALQNPDRTEEYINISKHELQRLSILVDKVLKMSLFDNPINSCFMFNSVKLVIIKTKLRILY